MKKNYMKPSLLSETFVAENIMSEEKELVMSVGVDLYLNGEKFTTNFHAGNTIQSISLSDFIK